MKQRQEEVPLVPFNPWMTIQAPHMKIEVIVNLGSVKVFHFLWRYRSRYERRGQKLRLGRPEIETSAAAGLIPIISSRPNPVIDLHSPPRAKYLITLIYHQV